MKINRQSLKILKRQMKDAEHSHKGDNGIAEINVCVKSEDELFSDYSPKTRRLLNSSMVTYIEECTTGVIPSKEYKINILTQDLTEKSKTIVSNTIRRSFIEKMADANIELKNTLIKCAIFMVLGFAFLGLMVFASAKNWGIWAVSILEIASWVFIWESVDYFFMRRFKHKRKKLKYAKLAIAEIEFKESM